MAQSYKKSWKKMANNLFYIYIKYHISKWQKIEDVVTFLQFSKDLEQKKFEMPFDV
jgi:uncharacterized protein involved in tellurium resistance